MYRRILVWFNASESSTRAFKIALQRAAKDGAELIVLAIVKPCLIAAEVESRAELDESIQRYKSALASLLDITLAAGVKARFEVVVEDCADQLLRHADRYAANLIVLDQHGSKFRRWLFGSVAEEVARHDGCP
jgi:nucleotide-binding universal stress UspA family protein